jgi:hypothetical protein
MEGYFVRTLGMHRVYNSAFMNMLRDEENANYRSVIKNTLSFDPEVLKRYVNFMNNPDERTAVDQFGKGDKYFGICTLMATLPGLPMFGHGQIEGYTERYGMEYRRAYHDEHPDAWLVARHEREISPLLHRRHLFAEVRDFLLYDFFTDQGHVNEDVFAYSNRSGAERALIVFNNRYASARGWVRISCSYAEKTADGGKHQRQRTLGESFGLSADSSGFAAYRDALTGLEYLHRARDLAERGLNLELRAYQTDVFLDWRDLHQDATHPWGELCDSLAGRGVPSLEDALTWLRLRPVHNAMRAVVDPMLAEGLAHCAADKEQKRTPAGASSLLEALDHRILSFLTEVERNLRKDDSERHAGSADRDCREAEAQKIFRERIEAALRLGAVAKIDGDWTPAARQVLPLGDASDSRRVAVWATVLGWCALEAIGRWHNPTEPEPAAVQLFDALRFREPLAEAFAAHGLSGDEPWRAAARLRASFAHSSRPNSPSTWIHDPDVAWLIGLHQHEGVSYVVKEHFERLLWWMALRELLDLAATPQPDRNRLVAIADRINTVLRAVDKGGYRAEAIEDSESLASALPERDTQVK